MSKSRINTELVKCILNKKKSENIYKVKSFHIEEGPSRLYIAARDYDKAIKKYVQESSVGTMCVGFTEIDIGRSELREIEKDNSDKRDQIMTIFNKYENCAYPISIKRRKTRVLNIEYDQIAEEHLEHLKSLGVKIIKRRNTCHYLYLMRGA